MQDLLGWSALETALAFLPGGLIVAFFSPQTGKLVDRVGTGPVIAAGLISFVAAYALFLGIDMSPTYAWAILPTMVLIGVGFSLAYPAVNMAATDGVEDHEQGLASGLVQASFQIGGALVLSIVTAVVTSQAGNESNPEAVLDAFRPGLAVVTGVAALGLLSAAMTIVLRRRAAPASAGAV
jgi:MFS family permease